jgi:acetyl esterase/lipase
MPREYPMFASHGWVTITCDPRYSMPPLNRFILPLLASGLLAAELPTAGIAYYGADATAAGGEVMQQHCLLDLNRPRESTGWPTLVWLHGGGLTSGRRDGPGTLVAKGIAVVAVGYRLSPAVSCPAYIEDAAAATAWTLDHIADYGGDPKRVFLGGHSAGAYLAAMVAMDSTWLIRHGRSPLDLAGLVAVSGQMTTHFTVRAERGQSEAVPVVDAFAPIAHVSAALPPMLLITGEERIEWPTRVAENRWFTAVLRHVGHDHVELHELGGFDHGGCVEGGLPLIRRFVSGTRGSVAAQPRRHVVANRMGQEVRRLHFGGDGDWQGTGGTMSSPDDLDARLSVQWEEAGLRIEVQVRDDINRQPGSANVLWQYDSVQLAFQSPDQEASGRFTELGLCELEGRPVVHCFATQYRTPMPVGPQPIVGQQVASVAIDVSHHDGSVYYALRIPAAWLGRQALAVGDRFRLSALVNDNDGSGRKGYLHWGDGIGGDKDPTLFNVVTLE